MLRAQLNKGIKRSNQQTNNSVYKIKGLKLTN